MVSGIWKGFCCTNTAPFTNICTFCKYEQNGLWWEKNLPFILLVFIENIHKYLKVKSQEKSKINENYFGQQLFISTIRAIIKFKLI